MGRIHVAELATHERIPVLSRSCYIALYGHSSGGPIPGLWSRSRPLFQQRPAPLSEEVTGFEPAEPLRRGQPEGSPECKSGAISRSATSPLFKVPLPIRVGHLRRYYSTELAIWLDPRMHNASSPGLASWLKQIFFLSDQR
jgi:hypothetical protein